MGDYQGTTFEGRYRIEAQVGAGAQGQVFRATDVLTGELRAIKVLMALEGDLDLVKRFRREYEACAKIDHPNVVRLHHLGRTPHGAWYYAMDFLPYPTMKDLVATRRPVPERRVLTLLLQAAGGVAAAHAQGIVHRDLKPTNLLVGGDDRLIVVDFGLARDASRTSLTATGTLVGTPIYMSPETIIGNAADVRADVWAFGVIAAELLTGKHPFRRDDFCVILTAIVRQEAPRPSTLVPGLRMDWDPLIARCLAKAPADRPSMVEVRDELLALRDAPRRPRPSTARPAVAPTPASAAEAPVASLHWPKSPKKTFAALFAGSSLAMAVWFVAFRSPQTAATWLPQNLRVEAAAGALLVRWQSEAAYPSRVRVEGYPGPDFMGQDGASVTSHEVVVAPLDEGLACRISVVLPSGDLGLPRTATTGRLRLEALAATTSEGSVRLSWRSAHPLAPSVFMREPGATPRPPVPARRAAGDRWVADLGPLSTGVDGLDVAVAPHAEVPAPVVVDLVPILRAELASAIRMVDAFDALPFLQRMASAANERMAPELERRRRERGVALGGLEIIDYKDVRRVAEGQLFSEGLARQGLDAAWERLVDLSPLVFGTRLIDDEGVEHAYAAVMTLVRLERYAWRSRMEPLWVHARRPFLGDFASAQTAESGPDRIVPCRRAGQGAGEQTWPMELPGYRARLPLVVDLDRDDDVAAAELVLLVELYSAFPLRLRVNDRLDLWLYAHDADPTEWHRLVLAQRLPPRLLRRGSNGLELVVERYFDEFAGPRAIVREAHVALWRRR